MDHKFLHLVHTVHMHFTNVTSDNY